MMIPDLEPLAVSGLDLRHVQGPAAFETANAADIAAHWEALVEAQPALYNGPVLAFDGLSLQGGLLQGEARTVGFATLMALLHWRGSGLSNLFGCAALISAEGDILLGRMGAHTAAPGAVKFVGGTPDALDLRSDGTVDLIGSIRRECREETGLDIAEAVADGLLLIADGPLIALVQVLQFAEGTSTLLDRIHAFLAPDPQPELAGIAVIASHADAARPLIPRYTRIILERLLSDR